MPTLVRRLPDTHTERTGGALRIALPLFLTIAGTVLLGCALLSFFFLVHWH